LYSYYLDTVWTRPPGTGQGVSTGHLDVVLCKFYIMKVLQILHCNKLCKSYGIPYNEHNCTVLYLMLKVFVMLTW